MLIRVRAVVSRFRRVWQPLAAVAKVAVGVTVSSVMGATDAGVFAFFIASANARHKFVIGT
jgi:hypothetical protein